MDLSAASSWEKKLPHYVANPCFCPRTARSLHFIAGPNGSVCNVIQLCLGSLWQKHVDQLSLGAPVYSEQRCTLISGALTLVYVGLVFPLFWCTHWCGALTFWLVHIGVMVAFWYTLVHSLSGEHTLVWWRLP